MTTKTHIAIIFNFDFLFVLTILYLRVMFHLYCFIEKEYLFHPESNQFGKSHIRVLQVVEYLITERLRSLLLSTECKQKFR